MLDLELFVLGNLAKDLHDQRRDVIAVFGGRFQQLDNNLVGEAGEEFLGESRLHPEVEDIAEQPGPDLRRNPVDKFRQFGQSTSTVKVDIFKLN